jgi:hypothetical protein
LGNLPKVTLSRLSVDERQLNGCGFAIVSVRRLLMSVDYLLKISAVPEVLRSHQVAALAFSSGKRAEFA